MNDKEKILMWLKNEQYMIASLESYQKNGGMETSTIQYYIDQIKNCNYNILKLLSK